MWLTVLNAPLMSSCNNDTTVLHCHTVYIAFMTTLIVSSVDFVTLLPICPSGRSPYSSAISERRLHIAVSMTLPIMLSKAIGLYAPRVCFAFCDLPGLARIMISMLCRCFRKYSYTKLVFVILAMMVVRGLLYIFRNPMDR